MIKSGVERAALARSLAVLKVVAEAESRGDGRGGGVFELVPLLEISCLLGTHIGAAPWTV